MSENSVSGMTMNDTVVQDSLEVASRGLRFSSALIDMLIIMLFTVPLSYYLGLFDNFGKVIPPLGPTLVVLAAGIAIYLAINGQLMHSNAQTVGKRINKIRVANLDGSQPTMQTLILKRYVPYVLFPYIPFIGFWVALVNVCWIFGREKRCLHDYIAGTKVVKY